MKVGEYRNLVSHMERIVNVDYHACVGTKERAQWVEIAKRFGLELIVANCPRANQELRERAERIIDRSSDRLAKVLH